MAAVFAGDPMVKRLRYVWLPVLAITFAAGASSRGAAKETPRTWKQVHPHWWRAYVLSFRSPDLLTREPDERWGIEDGRLVSGNILSDLPFWLRRHEAPLLEARRNGRPILLSLHVHSGYGTGLVTYTL